MNNAMLMKTLHYLLINIDNFEEKKFLITICIHDFILLIHININPINKSTTLIIIIEPKFQKVNYPIIIIIYNVYKLN